MDWVADDPRLKTKLHIPDTKLLARLLSRGLCNLEQPSACNVRWLGIVAPGTRPTCIPRSIA
jgi:hypothetical protein